MNITNKNSKKKKKNHRFYKSPSSHKYPTKILLIKMFLVFVTYLIIYLKGLVFAFAFRLYCDIFAIVAVLYIIFFVIL